jgi:hypothetical protein
VGQGGSQECAHSSVLRTSRMERGVSAWSVPRCCKQGTKSIDSEFYKYTGSCEERT